MRQIVADARRRRTANMTRAILDDNNHACYACHACHACHTRQVDVVDFVLMRVRRKGVGGAAGGAAGGQGEVTQGQGEAMARAAPLAAARCTRSLRMAVGVPAAGEGAES